MRNLQLATEETQQDEEGTIQEKGRRGKEKRKRKRKRNKRRKRRYLIADHYVVHHQSTHFNFTIVHDGWPRQIYSFSFAAISNRLVLRHE